MPKAMHRSKGLQALHCGRAANFRIFDIVKSGQSLVAFCDLSVQHRNHGKLRHQYPSHAPCEVSFPIRSCILVGKDAMVTEGIQGAISGPSKLPGKAGWFMDVYGGLWDVYGMFMGCLWWVNGGFRWHAYWICQAGFSELILMCAAKVRRQVNAVAWQVVAHTSARWEKTILAHWKLTLGMEHWLNIHRHID